MNLNQAIDEKRKELIKDIGSGSTDINLLQFRLACLDLYSYLSCNELIKEDVPYPTLLDVMEPYLGSTEYNGVVGYCQKWYYGTVVEYPWCATWISWCLAQLGLLNRTLNSKYENVFYMEDGIIQKGTAKKVKIIDMAPGDIVFLNFSEIWSPTASKHVTVCKEFNGATFIGRGGNQDNKVCDKTYSSLYIRGVYRPDYSHATRTLSELKEVLPKFA